MSGRVKKRDHDLNVEVEREEVGEKC